MSNTINGTSNTNSTQNGTNNRTTGNSSVSKDEFLQILAAQLSNQDPMNPTSDTDFIGQMAQFSALEQMQNLNTSFTSFQASSMIGKNVLATVTNSDGTSSQVYGQVTGVTTDNGTTYLDVGSNEVSLDQVSAVYNDSSMDATISQASGLIGKTIDGSVYDSQGNATDVKGVVDSIEVKNGLLYAKVGDKEVPVANISTIS
jgi:Flagellar hook capping protein